MDVSLDTKISIKPDVLIRQSGEEAVLLDLTNGHYFGLDDVGTRFWEVLAQLRSLRAAFNTLQTEFDVEGPILRKDLIELVERLVKHGMLEISPD